MMRLPLAWLQLRREPVRLLVALAGVAFAVILVSMQLGLQGALFQSAVRLHNLLSADLVLISPSSQYLAAMKSFSRRRLYQAAGFAGVRSVAPVYAGLAPWKNPATGKPRMIFVVGFDPVASAFNLPEVGASLENLADLYVAQGKYAEAEPLYRRALGIWERTLGREHPHVASSLDKYATLLRRMNRETEAAAMEARAKAIRAKNPGAPPVK